ncbi:MAG: ribosome-associated protein [Myxococcota bacterium]
MTHDRISRTQAKQQRKELEGIGRQLIALPASALKSARLPELLQGAVLDGQRMKRGALNRQVLYIGRLLQELEDDAQPIIDFVALGRRQNREDTLDFKRLERWRERLLVEGGPAIEEFIGQHPTADRRQLRQLVRTAEREQELGRPPAASRKLFKELRKAFEADGLERNPDVD